MTLTLSRIFTYIMILNCLKIFERGIGDMERTQSSRLKLVTCNCELDIAWLSYHSSANKFTENENPSRGKGVKERTQTQGSNL